MFSISRPAEPSVSLARLPSVKELDHPLVRINQICVLFIMRAERIWVYCLDVTDKECELLENSAWRPEPTSRYLVYGGGVVVKMQTVVFRSQNAESRPLLVGI